MVTSISGGDSPESLSDLIDAHITSPEDGDVVIFNGPQGKFINYPIYDLAGLASSSGIDTLNDVDITRTLVDGDTLRFNGSTQQFEPVTAPSPRTDNVTFQQYDGLSFVDGFFVEILFDETQTVNYDTNGPTAIPSWASLAVPPVDGAYRTSSGKQLLITEPGVYAYKVNISVAPTDTAADTTGYRIVQVTSQDSGTPAFPSSALVPDPNPNDLILPVAASGWFVVPTESEVPFQVTPRFWQNSGVTLTSYGVSLAIQKVI